jgi:hypothetical protein
MVGFYTNSPCHGGLHIVSLLKYNIWRFLSWAYISMGFNLNISQGYQRHGPWRAYTCQVASTTLGESKIIYSAEVGVLHVLVPAILLRFGDFGSSQGLKEGSCHLKKNDIKSAYSTAPRKLNIEYVLFGLYSFDPPLLGSYRCPPAAAPPPRLDVARPAATTPAPRTACQHRITMTSLRRWASAWGC